MKPTINMIAQRAGVSRGTVDRVLHGRPNVRPDKRERVLRALEELNYTPNAAARALALNANRMKLGVILPNWVGFFASEVRRGIGDAQRELADYGVEVLVEACATKSPGECAQLIDDMVARGVKGLALCAQNSLLLREKLLSLKQQDIPVITFNSDIPDSGRRCFVGPDIVKSGRIAAEIMAKLLRGDEQVLVVCGNLEFDAHKSRVDGFLARARQLGWEHNIHPVVESLNDFDLTHQAVSRHLAENPGLRGIYMANESVEGCVDAVRRAALPGGIKIVCHDLTEYTRRYLDEGWVDFVISQNMYRQGYTPVSMLGGLLMAGKEPEQDIAYTHMHILNSQSVD